MQFHLQLIAHIFRGILLSAALLGSYALSAQSSQPKNTFDINAGLAGHFFLEKYGGRPINGYPQGAQQSTEGKGVFTGVLFRRGNLGVNYDLGLRYDLVRLFLRVPTGSDGPRKVQEFVFDHHFAILKFSKKANIYVGAGYSMMTPGKGYEWTYSVFLGGLGGSSTEVTRFLKLKVETIDLIFGAYIGKRFELDSRLMYAPVGAIKWDPYIGGVLLSLGVSYRLLPGPGE